MNPSDGRPSLDGQPDPIWALLETARPLIIRGLADRGVDRVEYIVGFGKPRLGAVWLCTATDQERDLLSQGERIADPDVERQRDADGAAVGATRLALIEAGFTDDDLTDLRAVVVQSQETVDRDFRSSWFYALR